MGEADGFIFSHGVIAFAGDLHPAVHVRGLPGGPAHGVGPGQFFDEQLRLPAHPAAVALDGPVNQMLAVTGLEKIRWFSSNAAFRFLLIGSNTWKGMGYNMIIFITAIYGIDPGLFEAATVDGANRFKQIIHITIPAIMPMIMLRLILSLGNILSAGSEQILVLYNSVVYDSAEIIDTYVYKIGVEGAQYPLATAVGLFKSLVGGALIIVSYWIATRTTDYRIF